MRSDVIVRMAPSPTGLLHIGTARTALFNYLFAKQHKGKFILRIEDTDKERSQPEYEEGIIEGLAWLGITHDEFYRQSERQEIYQKYLQQLINTDKAYISQETPAKEGDRAEVIRFRNPGQKVRFNDLIRGEIEFDTSDLGDFVIAKDLATPLYHLAVIVDDIEMGITHVIRGEDHISNTPRQILLIEALGKPRPVYAHLPLILAPDRTKLSKRYGAVALTDYRERGYLKEALVNFLSLLGWSPQANAGASDGTNQEIFSIDELINKFDLAAVQKSGAIFNVEKLNWLNREYLKRLPPAELETMALAYIPEAIKYLPQYSVERAQRMLPVIIDRLNTLHDIKMMAENGDLDYYFAPPTYEASLLKTQEHLSALIDFIKKLDDNDFTDQNVKNAIWEFATEKGRGNVLWPMRVALSGKEKSPDPFSLAAILGKTETISRLEQALNN